jgi:hypothetical protein
MSSIRGVMLLPLSAKSHRSHTAHHNFLNKVKRQKRWSTPTWRSAAWPASCN